MAAGNMKMYFSTFMQIRNVGGWKERKVVGGWYKKARGFVDECNGCKEARGLLL
jgi:hypothetical protein